MPRDDDRDRPRPKRPKPRAPKRASTATGLLIGVGVGLLVLLLAGGVVGVLLLWRAGVVGPGGAPGGPLLAPPAALLPTNGGEVIGMLNDAAAVVEKVKSKAEFEAARPQLQTIGGRFRRQRPLLTTAVYLAKLTPGMPREVREAMAANVRKDPQFLPYRAEGEALAADPAFAVAYARYNRALIVSTPHTGGPLEVASALGVPLTE